MNSNQTYIMFNGIGIAVALAMLSLSIWMAPVDLSTKGFWGMGVFLLCGSLVNFIKYRMDDRATHETVSKIEKAKTEKLLSEYAAKDKN